MFTALDWVVIETTGLADPAPVIQSLLVDDQCKKYLRLDSVLTVVDSKHITVHLPVSGATIDSEASKGNTSEAALQIAFADRVLLNKVDLVSDDELQQVKDLIVKVNPEADIITCRNAEVDLNEVLNIRTFDPSEFSKTLCMEGERTAATSSMRSSGGFSFLPKDSSGKIDLSKSGKSSLKGSRSNTAPRLVVTPARLGSSHLAAMDVVCTVSLTLPASQPLDFDKLNV